MNPCWRVVVALLFCACLAADWPQLLGPNRDGQSAEKDLLDSFPAKGPPVVWQRDVGEGYASPVVAGGRLIQVPPGRDGLKLLGGDELHVGRAVVVVEVTQGT